MGPQTIAGRYHVVRPAGRGGMGTVWLCHDEVLGREVAVKQVGTLPGESKPDLARALREARTSAALNHRNVVSIYDAVEDPDHIWLVMEYVPSRTLAQIIAEDGPMPPERAAWIGAQVADGLAAAHTRGTTHRDVKPGNILVTEDDLAKVSDFGIARTLGDAQLTQSGLVVGTPSYFSPEVARGEEPTPAADVWALGATLYAAVEGHPPYPEQANPIATLATIASGPPPTPEHAGFLGWPIDRMLDPDPRSRWSMADAAHTLHRLVDQHAAGQREVTTAFADPATTVSSVAAGPVGDVPPDLADEDTGREPPEPGSDPSHSGARRRAALAVLAVVGLLGIVAAAGFALLAGTGEDPRRTPAAAGDSPTGRRERPTVASSPPASTPPDNTPTESTPTGSDPSGPTPSTSSPSRTPEPTASAAAGGPVSFVADYYSHLPQDTRGSWSMLSPSYRDGTTYGQYRGFWATIRSVVVTATSPVGDDAVDVTLTYTKASGASESEVRRIFLVPAGSGYQIRDDEVVG